MLLKHVYFAITGVFCQQLQSGDAVDLIDELMIILFTDISTCPGFEANKTCTDCCVAPKFESKLLRQWMTWERMNYWITSATGSNTEVVLGMWLHLMCLIVEASPRSLNYSDRRRIDSGSSLAPAPRFIDISMTFSITKVYVTFAHHTA